MNDVEVLHRSVATGWSEQTEVVNLDPCKTSACKVAYLMSRFPKLTETFVLFEMIAIDQKASSVEVFPLVGGFTTGKEVSGAGIWHKMLDYLRAPRVPGVMHPEAEPYVARAHYIPFLCLAVLWANLLTFGRHPMRYVLTLGRVIRETWKNNNFLFGSLIMYPKCVYFGRRMQRLGIDHVHAHFANHPTTAAYVIHRLTGLPYSFTAHGSDLHRHKDMLREKVDRAKFVVAISSSNKDAIVEHCGVEYAEKIHIIHCGVDIERFRPSGKSKDHPVMRVICVGTLHEVKGQAYLLRAIGHLREQGINIEAHFVGDGKDLGMLKQVTRDEALDAQVTFHGRKTQSQIVELLQSSDLLVVPSVPTSDGCKEGLPVVLMEAMACGLPVVASRLSGIPELINRSDVGTLVPPRDVAGIAAAIKKFAEDREFREQVGQNARERVICDFSVHQNTAKLLSLFQATATISNLEREIPFQ